MGILFYYALSPKLLVLQQVDTPPLGPCHAIVWMVLEANGILDKLRAAATKQTHLKPTVTGAQSPFQLPRMLGYAELPLWAI